MRRSIRVVVVGLLLSAGAAIAPAAADHNPPSVQPAALTKLSLSVSGTYIPIAGAFDCDSGSDDPDGQHNTEQPGILWYAPGGKADYLWTDLEASGGVLSKTQQQLVINRTYTPLVGDFDGDRCSDILWYGPGTLPDLLWWGGPSGFTTGVPIAVNGTYRPTTGHLGGNGFGILWYDPDGTESIWQPTGNRSAPFVGRTIRQVAGSGYQPVMFTDPFSGAPQILWYAPGSGADTIWTLLVSGGASPSLQRSIPVSVNLSYRTASCGTNVLLHGLGSQVDRSLTTNGPTAIISNLVIAGSFRVASTQGTRLCTTIWHAPGSAKDQLWLQQF